MMAITPTTIGVAFWVTEQNFDSLTGMAGANPATPISGTLYKCTEPGIWTAWYSPYAYPHPLRTSDSYVTPDTSLLTKNPNNSPNPFNHKTAISYQLTANSQVTLKIYDLAGREIKTLIDGQKPAGMHTTEWDGTDSKGMKVPSGTYFYRIQTSDGVTSSKKMIFLK